MRKVIDSNCLRSDELRSFLAQSQSNIAVITDYASMEAYKGNEISTLFRSMEILTQFPKQVEILKGTSTICGLIPERSELPQALVDVPQTKGFSEYCEQLAMAKRGDAFYLRLLFDLQIEACRHIERVETDAQKFLAGFKAVESTYSNEDVRRLRVESSYSETLLEQMLKNILMLSGEFFRTHPNVRRVPSFSELTCTFLFRISLCAQILQINWMADGSQPQIRRERIRNDIVDLNFAAFALYFDGFLSNDRRALEVYNGARSVLEHFENIVAEE